MTEEEQLAQARAGVLTAEQEKLIKSLDKESATRKLSSPVLQKVFYALCIAVTLYHVITAAFGTPVVLKHRAIHVGMILVLGFMAYPFSGKKGGGKLAAVDWVCVALSIAVPLYVCFGYLGIVERAGRPNTTDLVMATLLIVLVMEASRRMAGLALPILSLIFILYGLFGRVFPGVFFHRGYTWPQLSNHLFANTEGIYGSSVSIAASYIFLFILFGAVMSRSGMGAFFNDFATALAGSTKGGPAKVSVIASGFLGSINGSAVANVVTTGAFTIPLMKKTGYSKEFSGAVEAASSVGGQLLPPVMGAAAFIMAEILGIQYGKIIVYAAIPALLYYTGIFIQVHFRASKLGLVGVPRADLPKVTDVLKEKGHLLIPIIVLLYLLLFSGFTVTYSAVIAIIVTIVVACCRKSTRMSFKDILDSLADGAKQTVPVAMACACVGIIVGVISKTGFGLTVANAIIQLGGTSIFLSLIFTMITCMILGMGVPSIPAYIITATIAAPALAKLGIPLVAAHMFCFYYAMFANLTPPVALAAFAAAGLSGGSPMKTGFQSVKLAIAGFIVPFLFVFSPQLLLMGADGGAIAITEAIRVASGAVVGVLLIGAAVEGYWFTSMRLPVRLLAAVGSLCLIDSSLATDIAGLCCLVLVAVIQIFLAKKDGTMKGAPQRV